MPDSDKKRSIWQKIVRFIRKDFVRKLIAFVLAAIIYFAVLDRLSVYHELPGVDVTVRPPSGFVIMESGTQTVRLTVSGNLSRLKRLKPEDFKVTDLEIRPEKYQEGRPYRLQLRPSNFHGPLGVTVVSVTPEILQIDIDKLTTKLLPIKAKYDSSQPMPEGYKVGDYTVHPTTVRVTAPSMILKNLEDVETVPINLENMTESFEINQYVALSRDDIKVSPQQVLVRTNIVQKFEEKSFDNLKIHLMQGADSHLALGDIKHAKVTLKAPSDILNKLTEDDVKVYVLADDQPNGTNEVIVRCTVLKDNVVVSKIAPKTVKVRSTP